MRIASSEVFEAEELLEEVSSWSEEDIEQLSIRMSKILFQAVNRKNNPVCVPSRGFLDCWRGDPNDGFFGERNNLASEAG